jgi:hypothetical protein
VTAPAPLLLALLPGLHLVLALGLAVVASVTLHRVVSWRGLLVSSALLLASLCLYQPATRRQAF